MSLSLLLANIFPDAAFAVTGAAAAMIVATVVGMPMVTVDNPEPVDPLISPGERLAGADMARAAKVLIVRDWFAAGLLCQTSVSFK